MPIDNSLPDHPKLINFKTGEKPNTEYVNGLDSIKVRILNAPTISDLENYIAEFASGTWTDRPGKQFTKEEKEKAVDDLFKGYILPTALESIKITFIIEGMDISDVMHLIRHRTMGFSASGSGDRDMRFDRVVLKPSMIDSKYEEKIKEHTDGLIKIYAEMLDDPDIPILDPRVILPRNTEHYYYVTADLKAIFAFIKQRKDQSIEPESFNLVALKLWLEIVKLYPKLKDSIDFNEPDNFAIQTSIGNRSSNFYMPEEKNDVYNYKESWFCRGLRSEMRGGDQYISIRDSILKEIDEL